jgi:glycosyltransferase involved in cell wall biosynthesis
VKVLVVSPFPPLRDGVGRYAAQEVEGLRADGHEVEVMAPVACAAHHVVDLKHGLGMRHLLRYADRYDRVILQYQPANYHRRSKGFSRLLTNIGMWMCFRSLANLTVVCHEIEYPAPGWRRWKPTALVKRRAWRSARNVVFHTEREVEEMRDRLGVVPRGYSVRPHGGHFRRATSEGRSAARERLGRDQHELLLLCIGFIQPHKGFDRALRAFARVPGSRARLVIVGSIREETPDGLAHLEELRSLAAADPRAELRVEMLSDEGFDRWIVASDVVVLPYREIWSSGVFERAKLLGRPVIATDAGGIRDQASGDDVVVSDEDGLAKAMNDLVDEGPLQELPTPDSVEEAAGYVAAEAARRRGRGTVRPGPLGDAVHRLEEAAAITPMVLRSPRPVIGRALDVGRRVIFRILGWLVVPVVGQVNAFNRGAAEALGGIADELERLRSDVATLSGQLEDLRRERAGSADGERSAEPPPSPDEPPRR